MRTTSIPAAGLVGMRGTRQGGVVVPVEPPSLLGTLALELGRLAARLITSALRHPLVTGLVLLLVVVTRAAGPVALLVTLAAVVSGLLVWHRLHRASYRRMVTSPYRAAVVYRRR